MVHIIDAGCGLGFLLRIKSIGVSLHDAGPAPLRFNRILIDLSFAKSFDKGLPDLAVINAAHRIGQRIPVVEFPDNTDFFGIRSPDRKANTAFPVPLDEMCSQHFLRVIIRTLMKEVKIKLTER